MKKVLYLLGCLVIAHLSSGQNNVLRCKTMYVSQDTMVLDSLPCDPSLLPLDKVQFIAPNKVTRLPEFNDSIKLCFRVLLPEVYKTSYQTYSELDNLDNPNVNPILYPDTSKSRSLNPSAIYTNGSLSRGLVSGSNQGFLINSDLNLQLQGDLGGGVRLTAAVADNNSPLQPDGTTLKIQDFDRVFISIDKDSWKAVAGDYFMRSAMNNHFLKFNKKSRGIQFEGTYQLDSHTRLINQTHAAISRGRFARNEIQGQEGLQGPYRLTGAQNEAFIIVIAATESVFVDGKLLQRGQQNDYVINYNTAEIIFNPNVLITQYTRIVVEFQYADQNYSRVLFNQHLGLEKEKLKVRASYFIEQDNKNQPFQAENELNLFDSSLGIDARRVLAQAGDNESQAVLSTLTEAAEFTANQILYYKKDTAGFTEVLVHATSPDQGPFFTAIFSEVGAGNGNYIQINTSANGRVYAFVEPVNGIPQGSYEPVIQLVAPKRQQMASLAVDYQLGRFTEVSAELAYAQFNDNTFSVLDKSDDDALGSFIQLKDNRKNGSRTFNNQLTWERVSQNFSFIERYRGVEFDRKWNRSLQNPTLVNREQEENIVQYVGKFMDSTSQLAWGLDVYERRQAFLGLSPNWNLRQRLGKRIHLISNGDYLSSELNDSIATQAYQANNEIKFNYHQQGEVSFYGNLSSNRSQFVINDSWEGSSFQFQDYGLRSVRRFNRGWQWNVNAGIRTDWRGVERSFLWASDGINIQNNLTRVKGKSRFALISSLRFLSQNRQFFSASREQFLQQRLEYANNNYPKGYRVNFYLQSGTGREQKREFVFIEVPAGQGQYAWIDYNQNEIQEVNEFEISVFRDQAKFIKVYNLTNEFVNANLHEGNLNLKLIPAKWFLKWKSKNFQNWSNQLNFRVQQQNNSDQLLLLNPFMADTQILSGNTLLRNSIIYNSIRFGQEFTYKFNEIKSLLTYGSESNSRNGFLIKTRYNLKQNWQFDLKLENNTIALDNAFFANRNYDWVSTAGELSISWQNFRTRISLETGLESGSGEEQGSGDIGLTNFSTGIRYFTNISDESNLDISFNRNQIEYNGSSNSPLGFQVLSGQTSGVNYLWNLNLRTLVSKNIQISIGYEGRAIPEIPVVHIGRAEARYLF